MGKYIMQFGDLSDIDGSFAVLVEYKFSNQNYLYSARNALVPLYMNSEKNIRMEQAYKENYHLLIEIDGHERKFIIGKDREEFSLIESMGIANLSSERLKDMVEKYFIL